MRRSADNQRQLREQTSRLFTSIQYNLTPATTNLTTIGSTGAKELKRSYKTSSGDLKIEITKKTVKKEKGGLK